MPKQNPFSLYDFLGYFTPGAIFLYSLILMLSHAGMDARQPGNPISPIVFGSAELYIPFVLSSYLLGHVLSFLSSVFVERYSIWTLGYPSKYLLGIRVLNYFEVGKPKVTWIVIRVLFALVLLPISIVDFVFGYVLGLRKLVARKLDRLLTAILKLKVEHFLTEKSGLPNLKEYGSAVETDYFRFAYHFAVENCPMHFPKMQNYVALYGFLRTVAFVIVLFWWLVIIHALMTGLTVTLIVAIFGFTLLSVILYLGFIKFYRRFCLEVFMAISVYQK